jgi:hypothetical protein
MFITKMKFQIKTTEAILGTCPLDKDIHATYIVGEAPEDVNVTDELVDMSEMVDNAEAGEEPIIKGKTVFMRDEKGLYILNYLILGFIKEAGEALAAQLGIPQWKDRIKKFCFVFPRKIYFGMMEPDGDVTRALRAMTARGPRVCLATSEMVNGGLVLTFEVHLFHNDSLESEHIKEVFDYGIYKGLGQFRSGGYGAFEVISCDIIDDKTPEQKEKDRRARLQKNTANANKAKKKKEAEAKA